MQNEQSTKHKISVSKQMNAFLVAFFARKPQANCLWCIHSIDEATLACGHSLSSHIYASTNESQEMTCWWKRQNRLTNLLWFNQTATLIVNGHKNSQKREYFQLDSGCSSFLKYQISIRCIKNIEVSIKRSKNLSNVET